ncbi:MAG: Crp/Fnr family transcriptional regulator [Deltaproteobacteria bacterium]|nr:Crp/Fnr family transcriptional regulator [Deltaproteobacteria bacterium]
MNIPLSPAGINCFTCQMRDRTEWCSLKDEDLRHLNELKVCNTYDPGQIIFYQGNPCLGIYCVEAGTIAIRKLDERGNSALVRMATEGQTLGYRAFFAGGSYAANAEALTKTRVCFIDKEGVRALLERNPNVGLAFLKHISDDLEAAEDARLQASHLPVRARLAHLLLTLKDRFATVDDQGNLTIELPMARRDMADIVGTRPETIARTIRAIEDDGVATFNGRHVVVPDLDALLDELEAPDEL